MKILKTYKYRIFPNLEQQQKLQQYFGCVRFVYNIALETKITAYQSNKTNLSHFDLVKQLTELKNEPDLSWLREAPSQSLQICILNMTRTFKNFFRGSGFPKFKTKRSLKTISFPQGIKINLKKSKIFCPKLKWIDCYFDREFRGSIKTCTISQTTTGKYYISILVDNNEEAPIKKPLLESTTVGIDLGIKHFAITSDGEFFENQRLLIKSLRKLRIVQRSLSRKIKFSNNWYKQKLIVAKIHEKIRNQRKDFLHKLSTYIVKNYDTVCLEKLAIKNMLKNKKLAKHITDQSWSMFVNFLKYKCEWYGKNFSQIDRWFPSSKLCSSCGYKNRKLKLSDRFWICDYCNQSHDRDENAAINIKKEGFRLTRLSLI